MPQRMSLAFGSPLALAMMNDQLPEKGLGGVLNELSDSAGENAPRYGALPRLIEFAELFVNSVRSKFAPDAMPALSRFRFNDPCWKLKDTFESSAWVAVTRTSTPPVMVPVPASERGLVTDAPLTTGASTSASASSHGGRLPGQSPAAQWMPHSLSFWGGGGGSFGPPLRVPRVSRTLIVQMPVGSRPSKALSGFCGLNEPAKGAAAAVIDVEASSLKIVPV